MARFSQTVIREGDAVVDEKLIINYIIKKSFILI